MTKFANQLRKRQTDAENKIWYFLRNRKFENLKFRRQHCVGPFVVDFCCIEIKIIIEIDGSQHSEQKFKDANRTAYLKENGYRVLRFWNHDVLQRTEEVLEQIRLPLTLPSPQRGEGKTKKSSREISVSFQGKRRSGRL